MPLYLGLDAGTQGLTVIVIEIDGDLRRIVFNRTLNFDRDLAEYGTTGGMRHPLKAISMRRRLEQLHQQRRPIC